MPDPDLTAVSSTLPEEPERYVSRDNITSLIAGSFGNERKVLVLHGPAGSGKTQVLAQFVRTNPANAISFFNTEDKWVSSPRRFIYDLCQQMLLALGRPLLSEQVSESRLHQTFETTLASFVNLARHADRAFFVVLDGLDRLPSGSLSGSLLEQFPPSLLRARNVFVLLSSSGDPTSLFPDVHVGQQRIPALSIQETRDLLHGLPIDDEDLKRIHEISGGLPGYLDELQRQLSASENPRALVDQPPLSLMNLIDQEWRRAVRSDDEFALAVIAFATSPLDLEALDERSRAAVSGYSFIRLDSDHASFVTSAHKAHAAERLKQHRPAALELLTAYYERDPKSDESLALLPALLLEGDRYDRLKELVEPQFLAEVVKARQDPGVAARVLSTAAHAAFSRHDLPMLVYAVAALGVLRTTSEESGTAQAEISALAAVREFDAATALAGTYLSNREQLAALGSVGREMIEAGLQVPSEIEDAIDTIAESVSGPLPPEDAALLATTFFAVRPEAAIRMVERCAGGRGGRALDEAFAMLSLGTMLMPSQPDTFTAIQARIESQSLRDFAARFPGLANLSSEDVLGRLAAIIEVGSKLKLLRDWCNGNREAADGYRVTARALDIVAEATTYTPGVRLLRQLAEPLRWAAPEDARPVVERFMLLAEGLPEHPLSERVRLELILAEVECRWNWDTGTDRILNIYHNYARGGTAESRANALAQIWVTLRRIDPENARAGIQRDVTAELEDAISALLADSADHYEATGRVLRTIAGVDEVWALKAARQLNLERRRDQAICDVIRSAINARPADVDLVSCVAALDEVANRDTILGPALMNVAERMATLDVPFNPDAAAKLLQIIHELPDSYDRAGSLAWFARWRKALVPDVVGDEVEHAIAACERIAEPWTRIDASFNVARILSVVDVDKAKQLIRRTHDEMVANPLAHPRVGPLLADAVGLAIVALPTDGADAARSAGARIEAHIHDIAAPNARADMLARLASREYLGGRGESASKHIAAAIPMLDELDLYSRRSALTKLSGPLAAHDIGELQQRIANEPRWVQAGAMNGVLRQCLLQVPPDAPVDMDKATGSASYKDLRDAVEVLELLDEDEVLYGAASVIVRVAIEGSTRLTQRQLVELAGRLEAIAHSKLPDPKGISHDGYRVAFRALAMRLRAAGQPRGTRVDWTELTDSIRTLPNAADRVLVSCWVAELLQAVARGEAETLVAQAEADLLIIPNEIDRLSHLEDISDAYQALGRRDDAARVIRKAFDSSSTLDEADAHRIQDELVEKAEALDPELANSLTPLIDDRVRRYSIEEAGRARRLQQRPADISRHEEGLNADRLSRAAWLLRRSLAGNRIGTQSQDIVANWLIRAEGGRFPDVMQVIAWACENATKAGWSHDIRSEIATRLASVVDLGRQLAGPQDDFDRAGLPLSGAIADLPPKLIIIGVGDRERALSTIRDWMNARTTSLFRICDPYFALRDIEFLREVPSGSHIHIVASLNAQRGLRNERNIADRELADAYRSAWRQRYDDPPPAIDVTLLGTASGKTPFHDRYIFAEDGALRLGTSISGLGSRESEITEMDSAEAIELWRNSYAPWLIPPGLVFESERVRVVTFSLD